MPLLLHCFSSGHCIDLLFVNRLRFVGFHVYFGVIVFPFGLVPFHLRSEMPVLLCLHNDSIKRSIYWMLPATPSNPNQKKNYINKYNKERNNTEKPFRQMTNLNQISVTVIFIRHFIFIQNEIGD